MAWTCRGLDPDRAKPVGLYRLPLPPSAPAVVPFAQHGRAYAQPVIRLQLIGPRASYPVNVVVDTGAACCLLPEWLAWRVGVRQSASSPTTLMGSSVSRTGWSAWFEMVELQLEDQAGVLQPFRWPAVVGFTGAGSFAGRHNGILGVNGGLDRFQRVEFD